MQDLRLIGVHEDGQHVLLADGAGHRYRLPLDDALRAAVRRDRPRLGQLQIEIEGGLRPRDVQALVRRGLAAEEVAELAGWTVEKVQRFEGPILAEREYVVTLAQRVPVDSRPGDRTSLLSRVDERLRERSVDPTSAAWDSYRQEDGQWKVTVAFAAGGRQRVAAWGFDAGAVAVSATNDEARWLSEDDGAGPIPAAHVAKAARGRAAAGAVFDVEADGGVQDPPAPRPDDAVDLMSAMREHSSRGRKGRRRPSGRRTTKAHDDALPIEPAPGEGPATVPATVSAEEAEEAAPDRQQGPDQPEGVGAPPEEAGPAAAGTADDAGSGTPPDELGTGSATGEKTTASEAAADTGSRSTPRTKRSGRPSVPSWDDIVFGTRGDSPT